MLIEFGYAQQDETEGQHFFFGTSVEQGQAFGPVAAMV